MPDQFPSFPISFGPSFPVSFPITGGGLDPDAEAYALERGLDASQTSRLSRFLSSIKAAGMSPDWVSLGNSEWNALDGSTHHAVIGGDATITGSLTDGADGLVFTGGSQVFEFPNPAQSASTPSLAMFAIMATDAATTDEAAISGFYGNTAGVNRGPTLNLGESRAGFVTTKNKMGVDGTSDTNNLNSGSSTGQSLFAGSHRLQSLYWSVNGIRPMIRDDAPSTRPLGMVSGALHQNAGADPLENLWNNTPSLRVGKRGDGFDAFDGKYSLGMIVSHDVTSEMLMTFLEAILKNDIAPIPNPTMVAYVGDSMTDGVTGGVSREDSRSDQMMSQAGNWQQNYYFNVAQSGQPIEVQETFYATAKARLLLAPTWNRYVTFWGGYNISTEDFEDETTRDSILQRYLDMAEDAAQSGISSISWSRLIGYDGDPTTPQEISDNDDWNDKYAAGLATIQSNYPTVSVLWYDHRINYPTQFDGDTRTASYFVDSRHLSALGQQTLVADFIATHPNP